MKIVKIKRIMKDEITVNFRKLLNGKVIMIVSAIIKFVKEDD